MPTDFEYTSGRCHLFAIVFATMFNKQVTVWWDVEAFDDDMNIIDDICLIHSVVNHDDLNWDIEGNETTPENYPHNKLEIAEISPEEFLLISKEKGWPEFLDGEREHIEGRIIDIFGEKLDSFR